ncbi:hypothetical protein KIPB_009523, partial [Kipferlia bialata]
IRGLDPLRQSETYISDRPPERSILSYKLAVRSQGDSSLYCSLRIIRESVLREGDPCTMLDRLGYQVSAQYIERGYIFQSPVGDSFEARLYKLWRPHTLDTRHELAEDLALDRHDIEKEREAEVEREREREMERLKQKVLAEQAAIKAEGGGEGEGEGDIEMSIEGEAEREGERERAQEVGHGGRDLLKEMRSGGGERERDRGHKKKKSKRRELERERERERENDPVYQAAEKERERERKREEEREECRKGVKRDDIGRQYFGTRLSSLVDPANRARFQDPSVNPVDYLEYVEQSSASQWLLVLSGKCDKSVNRQLDSAIKDASSNLSIF